MLDLPPESATDMAAKLIAFTNFGDFSLTGYEDTASPILTEAMGMLAAYKPCR
jgi:hypothetical protein